MFWAAARLLAAGVGPNRLDRDLRSGEPDVNCFFRYRRLKSEFDAFYLVGAPSATGRFDLDHTRPVLGIEFTSDRDRRHATERG